MRVPLTMKQVWCNACPFYRVRIRRAKRRPLAQPLCIEKCMDIKKEIEKLERSRRVKIASDILKGCGNEQYELVVAAVHKDSIGVANGRDDSVLKERPDFTEKDLKGESAEVTLVARPNNSRYPENVLEYLDEGCEYGKCQECDVLLMSSFKEVVCPLCGTETHLS